MNIIEDVYNSLKDKYKLILTNTMALNEGFTIDTPVIVGQNENDKFWLYSEGDGALSSLVFLIRYYNRFHTNKEESIQYTHWHPMTINSAIYGIERFFKMPYIYWHAHNYCNNNRSELKITNRCGCFYCCRIYHTNEIKEWIDRDKTALCPYCGIDSVLPENDTYSLTDDFLTTMRKYWFESVTCGDGTQIFCEDL